MITKLSWKKFYFCITTGNRILPATESDLLVFASHLASGNISHTAIIVYLATAFHLHIIAGLHRLFEEQLTPRLQLVLKGIKRTQTISNSCRICLLITLEIMSGIKDCLNRRPHSQSSIMLWAQHSLAFCRLVGSRCQTKQSMTHLYLANISFDNWVIQSLIAVHIKQSKTDSFRKRVILYLGYLITLFAQWLVFYHI